MNIKKNCKHFYVLLNRTNNNWYEIHLKTTKNIKKNYDQMSKIMKRELLCTKRKHVLCRNKTIWNGWWKQNENLMLEILCSKNQFKANFVFLWIKKNTHTQKRNENDLFVILISYSFLLSLTLVVSFRASQVFVRRWT